MSPLDAAAGSDPRIAVHAPPLIAEINRAGVVAAPDVHVARRLGRLTGEDDERVLLAVALTVRALRSGSVCLDLDDLDALAVPEAEDAEPLGALPWPDPEQWRAAIAASPLVAVGPGGSPERPVRWVDGRMYLDRYWRDEQLVRRHVDGRLTAGSGQGTAGSGQGTAGSGQGTGPTGVDPLRAGHAARRVFPRPQDARQRLATACAVLSPLTVLTGGPGTGKTTTVARLLAALDDVAGPGLRIALAAPTGKAAARLQEAVRAEVADLRSTGVVGGQTADRLGGLTASTLHRLLGWRPGTSTRFVHHRGYHLPHDVVVVDETSMVSLPLMARLLEALRPQARVVLVGDPDQLASVEAGAVLGDLVARPPVAGTLPTLLATAVPDDVPQHPADRIALGNGVVRLERVHRHGSVIAELAGAVRRGRAEEVLHLLRTGGDAVSFVEVTSERPTAADIAGVRADAVAAGTELVQAARRGDVPAALAALERHRLLLAHRRGPAGVAHWAAEVEAWVAEETGPDPGGAHGPWYPGRPLLVTANDRDSGLYNGDTGVVVAAPGGVVAVFGTPEAPLLVRPHRLPAVQTVHAMTVHRGQGSQFGAVSLLLPLATSPLLTRELLYTAVTRARERVRVVGTAAAVTAAVERPVRRASGLRRPIG
ncbi:exodeoxyribonuclease V subunit alpha [Quadrisphaera sp. GCM10027208]|uniref:exodeoxyribonuclease V subunit alpha n=1 Tax=Quadrisphaera sp. GCM10027208 TaxID=3273423 RepID=UPI003614558A